MSSKIKLKQIHESTPFGANLEASTNFTHFINALDIERKTNKMTGVVPLERPCWSGRTIKYIIELIHDANS